MLLKEFDLDNYLFGTGADELAPKEEKQSRSTATGDGGNFLWAESEAGIALGIKQGRAVPLAHSDRSLLFNGSTGE